MSAERLSVVQEAYQPLEEVHMRKIGGGTIHFLPGVEPTIPPATRMPEAELEELRSRKRFPNLDTPEFRKKMAIALGSESLQSPLSLQEIFKQHGL